MSKRHYQAIAAILYRTRQAFKESDSGDALAALEMVMVEFALEASADNPRFDRVRFIEACETGTTKGMPKRVA